jgi:hypothetical protein
MEAACQLADAQLLDSVRPADTCVLVQAFLRMLAGQFSGRRSGRRNDEYGEECQPGLYPN